MKKSYDIQGEIERRKKWLQSEEYQKIGIQLQHECNDLREIASKYLPEINTTIPKYRESCVLQKVAINGTIHRGVYCPSPVFEIIVGKVKRGKVINRPTEKSNITHRYGINDNNELVYVEHINHKQVMTTEYLVREGSLVIGITIDNGGKLTAISEERYDDSVIQSYRYAEFFQTGNQATCFSYRLEKYCYLSKSLAACDVQVYEPLSNSHDRRKYRFTSKNGQLSSYTVSELAGNLEVPGYWDDHVFQIKKNAK